MIVSRTPYRCSLFGGGSDLPRYFSQHGGEVLGFTIDKFCYISLRKLPPFFEYKHRIVWSHQETVSTYDEIQHPAVREIMKAMGPDCGISLHHEGDLPARSGMGSSSSFTVGLLHALHAFYGRQVAKNQLATEAIHYERQVLKEHVGCQDQVWAAYGGFNHIEFRRDGTIETNAVIASPDLVEELNHHLMLVFTGFSRTASEIEEKKIANLDEENLHAGKALVGEALAAIQKGKIEEIGRLLHEAWRLKRKLAEGVTTDAIDEIYNAAMSAGATGGKLLGAGGGGFFLFFVPPKARLAVQARIARLIQVPFSIGSAGSTIVIYEPEQ